MRQLGKYGLVEPLATGGMAEVWRAEVRGAEGVVKDVAVKLIRGEYEADSAFVRMFVQEARLAARLGHANIVQLFEFDEIDGRYYIAMELVRGRHLGHVVERVRQRGVRIGVPRAVQIGVDVARALAYAHRLTDGGRPLGLVHRDVSPHNVLVSFEGEVKLADFGIARAMNVAEATAPGTVKGKCSYMAPEQARGEAVDARADVFALGVILWELCAGRRLFARDSEAATLAAVLDSEQVSPPSAWNEEVPPELDALVVAALEKDLQRRTRSAQELATALAAVLIRVTKSPEEVDLRALMHRLFPEEAAPGPAPGEKTRVRPVAMAREPVALPSSEPTRRAAAADETATRTAVAPARRTRKQAALVAGGAALLLLGAIAAALALRARAPEPAHHGSDLPAPSARAVPDGSTESGSPLPPPPTALAPEPGIPRPPPPTALASEPGIARPPPPTALAPEPGIPRPPPPTALASEPGIARPPAPSSASRAVRDEHTTIPPEHVASSFNGLAVPEPSSGDGVLSVSSTPWGRVWVDGRYVCDSPCSIRLRAGLHRIAVKNSKRRLSASHEALVRAGRREELLSILRRR